MRLSRCLWLILMLLTMCSVSRAQIETGQVSGLITDTSGGIVPGAEVQLQSVERGTSRATTTNGAGIYVFANIQPGPYQITVRKRGFKQVDLVGMIVNVQDHIEQNFHLQRGSISKSITLSGGSLNMNTTDGTVSTVVDQQYVANMPLNGRSFQDLILLTPGIVTNSPQAEGSIGRTGEFSVNGQRTESNYYSVDGVAANTAAVSSPGFSGISGSVASSSALGATQALVSVDALQEFRVQSSTYPAEFGRYPGGQISLETRSGTNQWHGTAFDYLRNGIFDANDWFTDYYRKQQPPVKQNDFGGTVGGPVGIPKFYGSGKKTFFFFSYEGLRLTQPQAANVSYVPDTALRESSPTSLQPLLNAFPLANGPDLGNGLAKYIGSWSNPSSLDAYSIRFDHSVNSKMELLFRFSDTPSNSITRPASGVDSPSLLSTLALVSRTYTGGVSSTFSGQLSNDFRINYTSTGTSVTYSLDTLGGALPANLAQQFGIQPQANAAYSATFALAFPGYTAAIQQGSTVGTQKQLNLVDTLSLSVGRHELKFGIDYRKLTPSVAAIYPQVSAQYDSAFAVRANSGVGVVLNVSAANPLYRNFSAFVQDGWRLTPRLSVSMGLRWEVNPAPGVTDGHAPYTIFGSSLSTLSLAPEGAPLWQTTWFNFAPRAGAAYLLRTKPGWETVVRGGSGVFYDTGQQNGSVGFYGPGFTAQQVYQGVPFPLTPSQLNVPIANPPRPPYSTVYAFPGHLELPYTLEWNGSVQQAVGKSQALTVSYVGSHGSRLLQERELNAQAFDPNFDYILLYQNGKTSDYNALEVQFQRTLTRGFSALASYTWSHCIDYGSINNALPYARGNCDFDVRQNFSSALSYDLPIGLQNHRGRAILGHWGLDERFTARTGYPVTLLGNNYIDPATGNDVSGELNFVAQEPVYLYGSQFPGGRSINPAAFRLPPQNQSGDAPRNFVRGFGAWQMDLAVRREVRLREGFKLEFRAEAFNVFNHPNFGTINDQFGSALFGQATVTLANSLGVLSPLYQQGAARSVQFALKVLF
jgi:hypothetical protein